MYWHPFDPADAPSTIRFGLSFRCKALCCLAIDHGFHCLASLSISLVLVHADYLAMLLAIALQFARALHELAFHAVKHVIYLRRLNNKKIGPKERGTAAHSDNTW